MRQRIFFAALLASALSLSAWGGVQDRKVLVYRQNSSGLRVSIETFQAREGWTPVVVSLSGAEVIAAMDPSGRVFRTGAEARSGRGPTLFTIELDKGQVLLGREPHAISVFERNAVRTRFGLAEAAVLLPLELDKQGTAGTLRFGGLRIPAAVNRINPLRPAGKLGDPNVVVAGGSAPPVRQKGLARLVPSRIGTRGK